MLDALSQGCSVQLARLFIVQDYSVKSPNWGTNPVHEHSSVSAHRKHHLFSQTHTKTPYSAHFSSTYTKISTIWRRLAWPLRKDDMQIHEVANIFKKQKELMDLDNRVVIAGVGEGSIRGLSSNGKRI